MERIIMHIDVNNAFLSWTAVDLLNKGYKVDIRKEVSVIGGDETKRRGIVLAKSIPAKKEGIQTAETLYIARKKCPRLKIYSPNYELYKTMSNNLFSYLKKYTSDIEIVSIDECFLDYGKVKRIYGDEIKFAYKIKNEIYNLYGFTVNIGIANNKLCAKMASDFTKPNKVHTLFSNEIKEKMWPLYIGDLYGIGKKSAEKLVKIGICKIEDLALSTKEKLYPYFKNQSSYMINIANGIDDSEVISEISNPKCISETYTLLYDYDDINEINKELKRITESITNDLKKTKRYTSVIAVIIKDKYFKINTHQLKLKNATDNKDEIYEVVKKLFKESWDETPVRLIGVRLDSLSNSNDYQISLFENIEEKVKDEKINKTIGELKKKFGDNIIK
ncbi:dNA polymerase IV [Clostridium sp. CAG:1193]|nr:dNA polymerase IV [Clostridium sp. CAG:1193]